MDQQALSLPCKICGAPANLFDVCDFATYWHRPPGGAEARGRQSALMAQMAQEKFIDLKIGKLLDDLRPYEESLPYDSDAASLIRVTRRE